MLFNICARVFGQAVNFDWIGLLGKLLILFLHSLYKLLLKPIVKVYSPLGKLKNRMKCFLARVLTSIMSIDYEWLSTIPHSSSWIKWKITATHCDYWLQTPKIPALLPFTSLSRENDEKCCKIVTDCDSRNEMKCLQNREPRKSRLSFSGALDPLVGKRESSIRAHSNGMV